MTQVRWATRRVGLQNPPTLAEILREGSNSGSLLTPTPKSEMGAYDEVTSRDEIIARGAMTEKLYAKAEKLTASLFEAGTHFAKERGLIRVDTEYELGLDENGGMVVIDEIHTSDASR